MVDETSKLAQAVDTMKPSTSTVASAIGGAVTSIVIWGLHQFAHVEIPGDVAAQVAVLATLSAGYFFSGGRSNDTV
jgi:hypothetical protein